MHFACEAMDESRPRRKATREPPPAEVQFEAECYLPVAAPRQAEERPPCPRCSMRYAMEVERSTHCRWFPAGAAGGPIKSDGDHPSRRAIVYGAATVIGDRLDRCGMQAGLEVPEIWRRFV